VVRPQIDARVVPVLEGARFDQVAHAIECVLKDLDAGRARIWLEWCEWPRRLGEASEAARSPRSSRASRVRASSSTWCLFGSAAFAIRAPAASNRMRR
jgi:hypothetical protein